MILLQAFQTIVHVVAFPRILTILGALVLTFPVRADVYRCDFDSGDGRIRTVYREEPCSDGKSVNTGISTENNDPMMLGTEAISVQRDADGRIHRSQKAKSKFKYEHPCPSTGKRSGSCPGYVVDHIKALACGGSDEPSNMQWQTKAEGKAKDRWERNGC